jgi:hypothetical protein
MTKKERERKKYGLLPPKIAESDTVSLGHGLCGSGRTNPFTIRTPAKTPKHTLFSSSCTHNDRSSNKTLVGLKLSKPQISQQHPSRICFITPGWHVTVTRDLNLLSLTMGANLNVSPNKCMTIMALKPNQLQVTTIHTQSNAIIERLHKVEGCQWHARHAQIIWLGKEKQSWKSIRTRRWSIWLLPSINFMVTRLLETPIIQHYRQHHVNLCLAQIWSTILPSEQTGIEYKNKTGHCK